MRDTFVSRFSEHFLYVNRIFWFGGSQPFGSKFHKKETSFGKTGDPEILR